MLSNRNTKFVQSIALALCIGLLISSAVCEKEPVDESETPRTDPALPSVVSA